MKIHIVRLKQSNMLCHRCLLNVATAISHMKGVQELSINLDRKDVKIVYNNENIDKQKITETINNAIIKGKT